MLEHFLGPRTPSVEKSAQAGGGVRQGAAASTDQRTPVEEKGGRSAEEREKMRLVSTLTHPAPVTGGVTGKGIEFVFPEATANARPWSQTCVPKTEILPQG